MRRLYQEMPQHIHRLRRMRGYPTKYLSLISYEWIDTRISLDDLFFFAQHAFNLIINSLCFLHFEGHILTYSKNASKIVLHYFATYIQVIVKHNDSFRIVWLSILYTNYKNDNFQYKQLLPPTFIYSTISLRNIHHIWTNKDINEELDSV